MRRPDRIRVWLGLEGTYGGFGFQAGLGAQVVLRDGDRSPRHSPEGPEIIPCDMPRRGSESLLPRRSGGTVAGDDHE